MFLLLCLCMQGGKYDEKAPIDATISSSRFLRERTELDASIGYTCKPEDLICNQDMGLVDRENGVWVEDTPPAVRKYLEVVGIPSVMKGENIIGGRLTEEESEQVCARVLLQDDGVKFKRVSFGEYMHLCYWGYRKLAGSQVKLPGKVKKQGGQCEFANAFVVVPRSVKPGVAFLRMVE